MGWREDTSPKRAWNGATITSGIFILIGTYLIILSIHHIFFPWTKDDFIEYVATLESPPLFDKSKSGPSLTINFIEANGFEFKINGDNYSVLRNKVDIENLNSGDIVSVLVDKSQFNAKISKLNSPTFLQKTINWRKIRVYEFKSNKQIFLDFKEVIQELVRVAKFYLTFGLICWIGTYFYLKREYRIYIKSKRINTNKIK